MDEQKAHVNEAAADLMSEGKKYVNELFDESLKKLNLAQKEASVYSDELLQKVREHPLKAVLIAGGIGLLLSSLLRK